VSDQISHPYKITALDSLRNINCNCKPGVYTIQDLNSFP
jgi:hypothetical protein